MAQAQTLTSSPLHATTLNKILNNAKVKDVVPDCMHNVLHMLWQYPSSITTTTLPAATSCITTSTSHHRHLPAAAIRRGRLLLLSTATFHLHLLFTTTTTRWCRWWHLLSSTKFQELSHTPTSQPNSPLLPFLLLQPPASFHVCFFQVDGFLQYQRACGGGCLGTLLVLMDITRKEKRSEIM